MDGNGRWARERGEPRTQGHLEGLKTAKRIVKAASDEGIRYLTLYVFSTENWKRTREEVGFVMGLVKRYLREERAFCRENNIRLRHAGDKNGLPPDIAEEIALACEETRGYTGLQVILALNYGGRNEITRAVNRAALAGADLSSIGEEGLAVFLDNPDVPDPDLIIRSAGEFRTSNFLVWEGAYAEYYSSSALWPDWTGEDLRLALGAYQRRERKFGGIQHG
jgi:undecaprenyl diphosphate synthase